MSNRFDSAADDAKDKAQFRALARRLAPLIHERWRPSGRGSANDVDFEELSEETRAANLAAAERIAHNLALVGLRVVPHSAPETADDAAVARTLTANLERLAQAEHEGWLEEKQRSGWTYGPARDDSAKHHPSIVPYHELSGAEKDKDRDSIARYQELLAACGFKIVTSRRE